MAFSTAERFERIARRCEARGLTVVRVAGWESRGHGSFRTVNGSTVHHTATSAQASGDYPSLRIVRDGRTGLPGPLSNFGTGRAGTIYLIAAGFAYHAGASISSAYTNPHMVGNEAENDGLSGVWPPAQVDAMVILHAEIHREFGQNERTCLGHKETASPPGRKPDPRGIDMANFRAQVAAALRDSERRWVGAGGAPAPLPPAPSKPDSRPRNADGSLTIAVDGVRGVGTIRRWQEVMGTPIDGVISKPKSSLIIADQAFLNKVVWGSHIQNLTGRRALLTDGVEGPNTIRVRQFWLRNSVSPIDQNRLVGGLIVADGKLGPKTNKVHQHALNLARTGSRRYGR